MNFWQKISNNPGYCSFHDNELYSLDISKEHIHMRICMSEITYLVFEDDLKDIYKNPDNNEFFIDLVFLAPIVSEDSILPERKKFNKSFSILSLETDDLGVCSLYFENCVDACINFFMLRFSFEKCIVKPFGEMSSDYYETHPEIFDKPFNISTFYRELLTNPRNSNYDENDLKFLDRIKCDCENLNEVILQYNDKSFVIDPHGKKIEVYAYGETLGFYEDCEDLFLNHRIDGKPLITLIKQLDFGE